MIEGIVEKTARGEVITVAALEEINAATQKQQRISIETSHQLARLFGRQSVLKNTLIQAGMVGFDLALPLKKKFIDGLLGKAGNVPRLLLEANG